LGGLLQGQCVQLLLQQHVHLHVATAALLDVYKECNDVCVWFDELMRFGQLRWFAL
jgi:hypothetical protein